MNEYSIVFWVLLENSLQIDSDDYIILANIHGLPFMKKDEAKQVMDSLKRMGKKNDYTDGDIERDRKRLRKILVKK